MGVTKLISPPTEQPVLLSELAAVHLKVDDTGDEVLLIEEYIKAATEKVQDIIQRQLMQATFEYQMSHFEMDRDGYLTLWKAPLVEVNSVKYYDRENVLQEMDPNDYEVDTASLPGRIRFKSFPSVYNRIDAVQVNYTAGYGDPGATADEQRQAISERGASRAKVAILRSVADFYEHRQDESPTNTYALNEGIRDWLNPLRLYL